MNTLAATAGHAGPNGDGWVVIVLLVSALGAAGVLALRNRRAGDADATAEDERGYRDQLAELQRDDTTSSRARFILDQQQATLPDTPYNQGCIRATAGYIRALEASNAPDGAA